MPRSWAQTSFLDPEVLTPQEPSLTVVLQRVWVESVGGGGWDTRPGCPHKAPAAMLGWAQVAPGTHPSKNPHLRMLGTLPSGGDDRRHVFQGLSSSGLQLGLPG